MILSGNRAIGSLKEEQPWDMDIHINAKSAVMNIV